MAKCYVLIQGFDRENNTIIKNQLFHSLEEIKPYVSGIKKKQCGFPVQWRAFSNHEKAQSFLQTMNGKGKNQTNVKIDTNKKKVNKDKDALPRKISEKMNDVLIPKLFQTPLVKRMSDDYIHIYVDGSYDQHKKIGGGGIVFVKDAIILLRDFIRYSLDTTNTLSSSDMERLTVKRAIELAIANSYTKVVIHYDFNGIVDCLKDNLETKDIGTKNYQKIMKIYSNWIEIKFQKEKAHTGNNFHDLADQLAKFAIRIE